MSDTAWLDHLQEAVRQLHLSASKAPKLTQLALRRRARELTNMYTSLKRDQP